MSRILIYVLLATYTLPILGSVKLTPFESFKNLKGSWTIKSNNKKLSIKMVYDTGSRGNIVTENFGKELSVISKDGESTILTHFCNRGHQSRLKLQKQSSKEIFIFKSFDRLNLESEKSAYVQKIIYTVKSKSLIDLSIVWLINGKETIEKYKLLRS